MSKHLLLVDDEPMVLRGLQRSLRSMQDEWTMQFAESGVEALEAMAQRPCDVIVTDMRMPGMNGAQLLNEVRRRSPHTVRCQNAQRYDQPRDCVAQSAADRECHPRRKPAKDNSQPARLVSRDDD